MGSNTYQLRSHGRVQNPVMKSSAIEIDNLLQSIMTQNDDYTLMVFEYTKEQEEEFLIKKLNGK